MSYSNLLISLAATNPHQDIYFDGGFSTYNDRAVTSYNYLLSQGWHLSNGGYVPSPTITSILPATGPISGGTTLTITGAALTGTPSGTTTVTIGGIAATITSMSETQVTCITPPGLAAGAVDIVLTSPNDDVTDTAAFTYLSTPIITSVSPASGPVAGGGVVRISGMSLIGTSSVLFNATAATQVMVVNSTTVTCLAPKGTAGKNVPLKLTTPLGSVTYNGAMNTGAYLYEAAPTIKAIALTFGPITGSSPVTITGTNLIGTSSVAFGSGNFASQVTVNPAGTSLTCLTPAAPGMIAGLASVSVTTPSGSATKASAYTYQVGPTISAVTPNRGPFTGGTTVTITGTDLSGTSVITFGGVAATNASIKVVNATKVTCTSPPGTGTVDVTVSAIDGMVTALGAFSYAPLPIITMITPSQGPITGKTAMTITGTNLLGTTLVQIGTITIKPIKVDPSGTFITCTTPAESAGTASISVTATGGQSLSPASFTYVPPPTITTISPSSGPVAGGSGMLLTTIAGTNLATTSKVTFGGKLATLVSETSTLLTCYAPAHAAGVVQVAVTTVGGTTSTTITYTYVALPSISAITPGTGPLSGGATVTISGANLIGTTSVTFGSLPATNVSVVSTVIGKKTVVTVTCTTPDQPGVMPGTVPVVLSTAGGPSNAVLFTVTGPPG